MILIIIMFFLFVNPVFFFSSVITGNILALVFFLPKVMRLNFFNSDIITVLLISLGLMVYYSFISLNSTESYLLDYLYLPISIIISAVFAKSLVNKYKLISLDIFMNTLILIVLIWSTTLVSEMSFPTVKSLLSNIFFRADTSSMHLIKLRSAGFHPTGGDGTSLNLMLLASICFIYITKGLRERFAIATLFLLFATLASLTTGRSGAVIALFTLSFLSLFSANLKAKKILFTILFLISIVYLYVAEYVNVFFLASELGWEHPLVRTVRLLTPDSGGQQVFITLLDHMLVLPSDFTSLIFGNGDLSRKVLTDNGPVFSDLGIIRVINGTGIIGYFSLVALYITPVILAIKNRLNSQERCLFMVLLFATIYVLLADFKISYTLTRTPPLVIFTLYFLLANSLRLRNESITTLARSWYSSYLMLFRFNFVVGLIFLFINQKN